MGTRVHSVLEREVKGSRRGVIRQIVVLWVGVIVGLQVEEMRGTGLPAHIQTIFCYAVLIYILTSVDKQQVIQHIAVSWSQSLHLESLLSNHLIVPTVLGVSVGG